MSKATFPFTMILVNFLLALIPVSNTQAIPFFTGTCQQDLEKSSNKIKNVLANQVCFNPGPYLGFLLIL
jgi:hypothetical protein